MDNPALTNLDILSASGSVAEIAHRRWQQDSNISLTPNQLLGQFIFKLLILFDKSSSYTVLAPTLF